MEELAEKKLGLTVNNICSFQQICDLEKVRRQVKSLWKEENKTVWKSLEKTRIYSLIMGKEKEWNKWWEENRFGINIKSLKTFYASLQIKICQVCGIPFPSAHRDRMYCGDKCKMIAWKRKHGIE